MDNLSLRWFDDVSSHLLVLLPSAVSADGLARGAVFLLVAARLAGFFCVGALLGRAVLSWPVRVGLVVLLTLIVAPGLNIVEQVPSPVRQVSLEERGSIARHEVARHETSSREVHGDQSEGDGSAGRSFVPSPAWSSPPGLLLAVLCDAGIGAALGLVVAVFLSGLKLAGEWLDRHSGLGMGSVLNPEYSAGGSAPAEMVSLFCVAVLLVLQPVNGHLLLVRFVLDTFHAIPVGIARMPDSVIELTKTIVQQSLILGLRIAMPFVVAMSLLDMTLGWVRRSSRWELAPAAYAVRAGAALLILAATLPGIQEAVSSSLLETLQHVDR